MSSSTEKLIEIVKKYPILYDLGNPEYKNIRKRDKIWDEIGVELDESGDDAKKKWKNMRDSYAKYLKSRKTKTGQAAKKNYKNWQWAPLMEHFRPFLAFAKTDTNVSEPVYVDEENTEQLTNTAVSQSDYSQSVETEDIDTEDIAEDHTNIKTTHVPKQPQTSQAMKVVESTSSSTQLARQKRRSSNKADERSGSAVDTVIAYLEDKRKKKVSPTDMIFMGYAETIQTFSPRRQAYVKMKIAAIMTEQECLHQEEVMANKSRESRAPSDTISYNTNPSLLTSLEAGSSGSEYNSRPGTSNSTYCDVMSPPLHNVQYDNSTSSTATFFHSYTPQ